MIKLKNENEKNITLKILQEKVKDDEIRQQEEEFYDKMMVNKARTDLELEKLRNNENKKNEYDKLIQIKLDNDIKQKDLKKEKNLQKQKDVEMQEN
jgi:hypothetical protein